MSVASHKNLSKKHISERDAEDEEDGGSDLLSDCLADLEEEEEERKDLEK